MPNGKFSANEASWHLAAIQRTLESQANPPAWTTYRTSGSGTAARLVYHPEWSAVSPWVSYRNGTAGQHFSTLENGLAYFKRVHNLTLVLVDTGE